MDTPLTQSKQDLALDCLIKAIPMLPRKLISLNGIAAATGMTPARVEVVLLLHMAPRTLSELSEEMNMVSSNTSPIVRSLVERGYCERSACAKDHRKVMISLTDKGEALVERIRALAGEQIERLEKKLGPDGLEELYDCMSRLLKLLASTGGAT